MSETLETLGTPPNEIESTQPVINEDNNSVDITPVDGENEDVEGIEFEDNVLVLVQTTDFKYVGDLVNLAEAGDKSALIKRASEIEAGFSKIHEEREFVLKNLQDATDFATTLQQVADGDEDAIEDLVTFLYSRGVDVDILTGAKPVPQKASSEAKKLQEIEAKLQAIEQEKKNNAWIEQNADKLLRAIKPLSSVDYTPQHLLKARPYLPKKGAVTPENLLVAIHQGNPELTTKLVTRQPKTATPQMSTSMGASGSTITGVDLSKMNGQQQAEWWRQQRRGSI